MKLYKNLIFSLILFIVAIFFISDLSADRKRDISREKRDPFVPLVDRDGRIRSGDDLFQSVNQVLPIKIDLKGILWGGNQPIVIINDKVFKEGSEIIEGLTVEKIKKDKVILNYLGKNIIVEIRKREPK